MLKNMNMLALWVLLALGSSLSLSDPIQDMSMKGYKAGWFPNFKDGQGPMTCPETCKTWVDTEAEHELTNNLVPDFETTYVCKSPDNKKIVFYGLNEPKSHWVYGNQFDEKPDCLMGTPSGVEVSDHFMCLCVDYCRKPDLVVSKINDPVWDGPGNQSVITVDITNIGSVGAPSSYARMIDPGTMANDVVLTPPLAPGATVTLTFYISGYWVFDPNAVLEVTADYKSDVDECDESNNVRVYFKEG